MVVIKRDGQKVDFDRKKIVNAILKSFLDADGEITDYAKNKAKDISTYISKQKKEEISVEDIQDIVEDRLMTSSRKDVAKKYINYRYLHKMARDKYSDLMDAIKEKVEARDVQNQNANVDEKSFGGRAGEAKNLMMKQFALDFCMSEMSKNNHLNNEIYIHDLDSYAIGMHNCLSIPFDKLLANGFNTRQTDVRPAQSVNTAGQLMAVIFQLQSLQQFGGCSATHCDWTLAPYVRKSFMKHYIVSYLKQTNAFAELDLMSFLFDSYEDEIGVIRNRFEDWVDDHKKEFFNISGLSESDFNFNNKDRLDEKLYQSAMYDTISETRQAVEALYHNLNTLQSRSGNQLK